MADGPDYLPLAGRPPDDQDLLARAFWLLLDHGRPVELGALADALQREPSAVAAAVDRLEQAGLTRRDPAGRLLGSHGLSVAPTHHELLIDGRRRWTWCAYDAMGILGALEADGRVRSRSPHSGTVIELTFDAGQPAATDAVVFMAEGPCRSVIDDWCPLVNLFEHDQAAAAWASRHGITGAARPVAQATRIGAAAWRAYLWPGTTPAGCCPQGGPPTFTGAEQRAHGRPMSDPITVVPYDPAWPEVFRQLGTQLRAALGGVALRIDHIGSTAVPGLAAKPIVDVQISVERLEPVEPFRSPLEAAGFLYRAANAERTKRYFREPPGQRRTHVHVRRAGSFSEQLPLLFRDFLRADPAAALDYGQRKQALAARWAHDRRGYLEAKLPIVWDVLRRADQWAQRTGWEPGPSDA